MSFPVLTYLVCRIPPARQRREPVSTRGDGMGYSGDAGVPSTFYGGVHPESVQAGAVSGRNNHAGF